MPSTFEMASKLVENELDLDLINVLEEEREL